MAEVTAASDLERCLHSVARLLQCDEVRVVPARPLAPQTAKIVVDAPDATPEQVAGLRADGFHSALSLPLVHQGIPLGRLEAYRRHDLPWGRYEVSRARMVSYLLAAAVHRVGGTPLVGAA